MAKDEQTPPAAVPKKRSRTLLVALVGVVLLGGGAAAYWTFGRPSDAPAHAEAEPGLPPAMVNLDPFVVNLADPGGARFLRVTLALIVPGEEVAKEFAEDPVARLRVRSSIIEMLAQQTAEQLTTPEGKTRLKAAIVEHASAHAAHLEVSDVLFSEFIVQ
jgi:flagellar FliL protein